MSFTHGDWDRHPGNLAEAPGVVRDLLTMRFSMLSCQPAAFVGDSRRWSPDLRSITPDDVWAQVERGVGTRLPFGAVQLGDVRCNRTAFGWRVAGRWVPLLDDTDPRDLRARDEFPRPARRPAARRLLRAPEDGRLVPACVQHSVLDPGENAALRRLLPITPVGGPPRP